MWKLYPSRLAFNRVERRFLRNKWVTNGVWAAKWVNVWELIRNNIRLFPKFDPGKINNFVRDWERISDAHDIEYLEGNTFWSRIKADWRFAKATSMLCHWAGKRNQSRIRWLTFLSLLKFWGNAYNYKRKLDVYNLYPELTQDEHKKYW